MANINPKFSIIVPVYNTEMYLERCLNSLLSQDYSNYEIILVNDGSNDASGLICDKYARLDDRIRVIHKENGGASSAKNQGLIHARGSWITFCDSDDYVYKGWLKVFADNCNDVDIVNQGIRLEETVSKDQKCRDVSFSYKGAAIDYVYKTYESAIVGYMTIKCFRKELLDRNHLKFDESLALREDEEFVLRYMMLCKNAISIPIVGYHYFVPDFKKKYSLHAKNIQLCHKLFENSMHLYSNSLNAHVKDYLNLYTGVLVKTFISSCSVYELKKYKQTVGNLVYETGLPLIIIKIVHCDRTLIFSSSILYFYSLYINIKDIVINICKRF